MQTIIEGVDRLGKDTLIRELINRRGYSPVIHFSKPVVTDFDAILTPGNELFEYQYATFVNAFQLIKTQIPFIFNRGWLGEVVYSHYRGYSGNYVFDLEKQYGISQQFQLRTILLTTSNWDVVTDDGKSFDFSRKKQEQEQFLEALDKSIAPNKIVLDICNEDGTRKTPSELVDELLTPSELMELN